MRYKWNPETKAVEPYEPQASEHFHAVHQDSIDPQISQADGLWYDSKKAMHSAAKAKGMIPVGDDDLSFISRNRPKVTPVKRTLLDTYERLSRK